MTTNTCGVNDGFGGENASFGGVENTIATEEDQNVVAAFGGIESVLCE
jgi:hypothetical protein